jgi:pimeloyl-ACP methyl ester carboxylesterase
MYLNHYRLGTGTPLVLIHGIGSQWQMWRPVLGRLAQEHDVLAIDLPGFGASSMPPPGTPAGVPSLTNLVVEFLDQQGVERPHVAGNAMGGWISLELAKQGRAASATPLSPAGFHQGAEAIYQRAALKMAVGSARLLASRADGILASPAGRAATLSLFFAKPSHISASEAAQATRALAGAEWFDDTLDALIDDRFSYGERIKVPVTIAWGSRDHLLLPRQAPRARREIPGSRLILLEGCGHVPTWDDPDHVARVILEGSRA